MRTSAIVTVAMLLLVSASGAPAQSQQKAEPGMQCPMAGMMSNIPAGQTAGNMNDMMKMMGQRMADMSVLSGDELVALLSQKEAWGLSDAQVKEIAASIQAAQRKKVAEQMERMKSQMQAGGMTCPCRNAAK